jgi:thiamine kinase-like enzyme
MAMLVWLSLLSQLQTAVGHFVQLYRRIHKAAQEERQADTRR